ncbi:HAD family hydrolase [Zhouia amylolytica]|uniref:HAD family hydrolase n=1 Tax=Zhouia amylolytica TaxID=376730 RepID=UPI0020CDA5D3|nr:HAD hydrolase-like protein [Zhouia amylolytica]MCQ0113111.1 HAD family hydrolase [Zhouia amylolytica]
MIIKNIFFDFDGVIAESVNAKTEAFREMYQSYGNDISEEVVQYHLRNGGVSRFEKFKYWQKKYFNENVSEVKLLKLAERFSELVLDKVVNADEVKGSTDFIKKYYDKLNFWVITGTPTTEIKIIAEKRGLDKYFLGVHGSPENKRYWTEYLIEKFNLKREETLFLGDATTDQDAASYSNLKFALRENNENKLLFKEYEGMRFSNFEELENNLLSNKLL